MKKIPITFLYSLIAFTFTGWIGWIGLILIGLKIFGVIHWPWWIAAFPLEYGAVYCLYMTIDGAKYRSGHKDAGIYAQKTQNFLAEGGEKLQIQTIVKEGPEKTGETIDKLSKIPSRLKFNQALLDASLKYYDPLQLAMFGNKSINAHITLKKWRESGLEIPENDD